MKKIILAALAAVVTLQAAPAMADPQWGNGQGNRYAYRDVNRDGRYDWRDQRALERRDNRRDARRERRLARNDRVWQNNGRYYCRRSDGTTGTVIGAGLGALAGNTIAGRGDKTLGTILGGVGGGLLGRSIDRGDLRCR
jgi:hypothetical protein